MKFQATLPVLAFYFVLVVGACASERESAGSGGAGPVLIPLDSVLLVEADTLYIGNPFTPVVDPFDGTIYVPDLFSNRVMRFGRDGSLIRVYGRPGDAPGEFRGAGSVAVIDESTILVHDMMVRRLSLFDRNTGEFLRLRHFGNSAGTTPPIVRGHKVWFATASGQRRDLTNSSPFSLARWDLESDSIEYFGVMPAEFMQSIRGGNWTHANQIMIGALAFHERGLLRGWQANNELLLLSHEGSVLDTLNIPIVRRKGSPKNVRALMDVKRIGAVKRI